jgi:hypothetical protein
LSVIEIVSLASAEPSRENEAVSRTASREGEYFIIVKFRQRIGVCQDWWEGARKPFAI